jgi:hypothetical protein
MNGIDRTDQFDSCRLYYWLYPTRNLAYIPMILISSVSLRVTADYEFLTSVLHGGS